ncbi:hypothetical protein [Rhizobium sp. NRK18]|uniref:hypothetical protein n=1 Tax=Rhizobium sp. NRK18 TaxID=2964667 RepID=UPI0021C3DD7A|nr:hypothetical protein [Rhizobium sp. NRK18]MCQ2002866.1 hypothetical protein [Rhizobium sp. NRK18]
MSDYLPLIIFGAFVLSVFGWWEWEFHIKSLRVSRKEIAALADEMIEKHGPDAEERAYAEEDAAWRRSNTVEQGKWRRVRKELWRRHKAGEWE